jgi:hypothetical protein
LYRENSIVNGPYFKDTPAVAKVQNWRVLIDTELWPDPACEVSNMFTHFCRDVYQFSLSSLRIVVIPGQVTLEQLLELQEAEKENFKDLKKLFWKLKHFEMTDAKRRDAPTGCSF